MTGEGELIMFIDACVLFAAVVGILVVAHGVTRRRDVATSSGQQLICVFAGVLSYAAFGPWLASTGRVTGPGLWNQLLEPMAMAGVDLVALAMGLFVAVAVLVAMAERTTYTTATAIGVVVPPLWGLAVRLVHRGLIWDELQVEPRQFVDQTGLMTAGAVITGLGFAGTMVIGPRLGRLGTRGQNRLVAGASIPAAVIGTAILVGSSALHSAAVANMQVGVDQAAAAFVMAAVGGAGGSLTAAVLGRLFNGHPGSTSILRGALGGTFSIVATSAGDESAVWSAGVGALAGGLAVLLGWSLYRVKVDDPAGLVSIFAVATTVAAAIPPQGSVDRLIGVGLIAAGSFLVGTVLCGTLSLIRLLRVDRRREISGLVEQQS